MEIAFYGDSFIDINDKVVPIDERGHQFGDGVYEYVKVYNGTPFLLDEHLERLEKSALNILLQLPYSRQEIKDFIQEGLRRSGLQNSDIYIQVTRGISPRNHLFPTNVPAQFAMTIRSGKVVPNEQRKQGISVMILEDERWANCFIKSLNLLPNLLAKQKAFEHGHGEAILSRDGYITEGSSSNVFAVKDGVLYTTPATNRILHGITRAAVIECASKLNIPFKEYDMSEDFLRHADEVFITSTSVEVLPVSKVESITLPDERPITTALAQAYSELYATNEAHA
ncbi:D-amino-acid transaminase [Metabacillus iocasae]|uniref:D-alanine aminotransferase n=1 Tax=Priestia iocasae TaxID=2291674 RepID=A0ABS2QV81_9BACI|nr:D-amino-acid transaminase [Metabacillus iocasae]MBM7703178.1 D-alanine transaminase [Metabacillus iocasae]